MKLIMLILLTLTQFGFGQDTTLFRKDIPKNKSGHPFVFYYTVKEYEEKHKLETAENGFDSLQIRIWYYCSKCHSPKNIFILKRQNNLWTSSLISFGSDSAKNITSKTNINAVVNKLMSFEIMTLPDMYDIKGLNDKWLDGEGYVVETSEKTKYRMYYYHMPKEFERKFVQARQFVNILKLLRQEFNIPLADKD